MVRVTAYRAVWHGMAAPISLPKSDRRRRPRQHAFQVCRSVFTVGRRRLRPAVERPRVARRTWTDVAE
jgi:hypothetical protein